VRLDAFSGASDKIYTDGFDTPVPAEHFHGVYSSIDRLIPQAVLEPYVLWKLEHNVKGEVTKTGNLDTKTGGVRWVGKLPMSFDYGVEMALQRGLQAREPVSAWAGHAVLGWTVPHFAAQDPLVWRMEQGVGRRQCARRTPRGIRFALCLVTR
jgi:hypothetical protein